MLLQKMYIVLLVGIWIILPMKCKALPGKDPKKPGVSVMVKEVLDKVGAPLPAAEEYICH
ncbi:hypothetical protein WIW50_18730 [Flavobacteriaceae bacterium 3-367]|uniref:hypothetical protein n=1 Tax=Eudoraea algarum TaxID=3417568 RepID=UPI003268FB1A